MRLPGPAISINDADAVLEDNAGEGSLSLDRTYMTLMKQAAKQLAIGFIRASPLAMLFSSDGAAFSCSEVRW